MTCQNPEKHFGKIINFCSIGIFYKITRKDPEKKRKKKIGRCSQADS